MSGWFTEGSSLVVSGVSIDDALDLVVLVRYLVDPAFVRGTDLVLEGEEPGESSWNDFGRALETEHLMQRYRYVMQRVGSRPALDGLPPLTPIEEQLLLALREQGLSPRVQFGIEGFRVDFAFEDVRLAIEADGREWHDSDRDAIRDERIGELGWSVMHFTGSAIWNDAATCAREAAVRYAAMQSGQGSESRKSRDVSMRPSAVLLDDEQRAAVVAPAGVVQVIAPAGSGKTTVLVERVRFLLSHGMPAPRILSTTFNREAKDEMRRRFAQAGIAADAATMTFHGLGHHILDSDGRLPKKRLEGYSWKRLAKQVLDRTGVYLEPDELPERMSHFKLVEMKEPEELDSDSQDETSLAQLEAYRIYTSDLRRQQSWDFDDLVFLAVRHLRADPVQRRYWQDRWWYILVDEYQDIEPAQEELIRILSNPHDNLFIVGDEDQCIYTWRRAEVRRIMGLYMQYPSMRRLLLRKNYRSGKAIVEASRKLVENNKNRFSKDIVAHRSEPGTITRLAFVDDPLRVEQLRHVFQRVSECDSPKEMAVLCRTNSILRDLAFICITSDVSITASERILRPSPVEEVVLAYLLMVFQPSSAEPEDVKRALRSPSVYLKDAHATVLLNALRKGLSFQQGFGSLPRREQWREQKQAEVADRLERLKAMHDAQVALIHLRREIGLDDHFDARAREGARSDDADAMDSIAGLAQAAKTTSGLIHSLMERREALKRAMDGTGVELVTIHGAKGREWSEVILAGADEERLPLTKVVDEGVLSAVWEDERRLAYVAMTRARDRLSVVWSGEPSPYVLEALDGRDPQVLQSATLARNAERRERREAAQKTSAAKPGVRSELREFPAKLHSVCNACGSSIVPGEMIVGLNPGYAHTKCLADESVLTAARSVQRGPAKHHREVPPGGGAKKESRARPFRASFPGVCAVCSRAIAVGEMIVGSGGAYRHARC